MELSIKYEWFRDWFRGGFVWFRGVSCISRRCTITHRILSIFLEFCVCFHEARERSKMSRMEEQGMTARQYIRWLNAPGLKAGSIPFVYACTYCVYE